MLRYCQLHARLAQKAGLGGTVHLAFQLFLLHLQLFQLLTQILQLKIFAGHTAQGNGSPALGFGADGRGADLIRGPDTPAHDAAPAGAHLDLAVAVDIAV